MSIYNNSILRNVYFKLPEHFKNLFSSLYGYNERFSRYGEYFRTERKFLEESQFKSNDELLKRQKFLLNNFLNIVLKNSMHYKGTFYGDKEKPLITDFKIFDKSELRSFISQVIPENLKQLKPIWAHTSGTTGSSLVFPISKFAFQREYAFRDLHYSWGGSSLAGKEKFAMFYGHPVSDPRRTMPPFWVYDFSNNWLIFSSYHFSETSLKFYCKKLLEFNPKIIAGYPSSLYVLAKGYKKFGNKICNLSAIFSASETLQEYQRKEIEEVFQVKLFNWYGNSEMCANIVECEKGRLHLKHEHSFVEIINEKGRHCKPGETGNLVCTNFANLAFPLVRYNINDQVTISTEKSCPCGRAGILIADIIGRKEDYILTPDGRKVGRLDHIFKDSKNVMEAQLVQNVIDKIEINIVASDKFSKKDEIEIIEESELRLGKSLNISINKVSKIDRGPNNKFRFIISNINKG